MMEKPILTFFSTTRIILEKERPLDSESGPGTLTALELTHQKLFTNLVQLLVA
jgi:hypothetical protein